MRLEDIYSCLGPPRSAVRRLRCCADVSLRSPPLRRCWSDWRSRTPTRRRARTLRSRAARRASRPASSTACCSCSPTATCCASAERRSSSACSLRTGECAAAGTGRPTWEVGPRGWRRVCLTRAARWLCLLMRMIGMFITRLRRCESFMCGIVLYDFRVWRTFTSVNSHTSCVLACLRLLPLPRLNTGEAVAASVAVTAPMVVCPLSLWSVWL